ncbi:serine/threonine-protein kinase Chk1-like [Oratosquilla oratoria]|uniref:serine/threonine-protein kinase Chk1-like n=1 Tax=Oratosquilla oratoria TaxID=337810 RepID=UPI003F773D7D
MASNRTRETLRVSSKASGKRKCSEDEEVAHKKLKVQDNSPCNEGPGNLWTEVEYLGEGSFGIVTLVRNTATGELAARKEVEVTTEQDKQELLIHRRLEHANVVRLLSAEQEGAEMHMYLEFAVGGDLSDEIGHSGMGEEQAHFYFVQLMNGVGYLHAQGIAHRDLKPNNLLLTEDRVLKIGDFGLSAEFLSGGEEVFLRGAFGTRKYMAPEVFSGRYRGAPADLWSCGIILVELITGRTPWRRARPRDGAYHQWVQQQHLNKVSDPSPHSSSDSSVVALISHILTPDPKERATHSAIRESGWFKK